MKTFVVFFLVLLWTKFECSLTLEQPPTQRPECYSMVTCNYTTPCSYTLKPGCMAQFVYAPAASVGFRVVGDNSRIPFTADFGPNTRSWFTGTCCVNNQTTIQVPEKTKNVVDTACRVERTTRWTYAGSCDTTCFTYLSIHNIGSTNGTFTVVGMPPV